MPSVDADASGGPYVQVGVGPELLVSFTRGVPIGVGLTARMTVAPLYQLSPTFGVVVDVRAPHLAAVDLAVSGSVGVQMGEAAGRLGALPLFREGIGAGAELGWAFRGARDDGLVLGGRATLYGVQARFAQWHPWPPPLGGCARGEAWREPDACEPTLAVGYLASLAPWEPLP